MGLAIVLLGVGVMLLGIAGKIAYHWLREIDRRLDAIEAGPSPR